MINSALAFDINITLNVTPALPPPSPIHAYASIGGFIMAAGAILQLVRTFIAGSPPREKIDLMIAGVIIFVLLIYGIALVIAV
jgi:hypothetical protein